MDIEKLIESAEHCDLGDCANCPSCGRVCCKERTMGELAREVKRLQAENKKLRAELENYRKGHREEAISALSPPNEPLTTEQLREMDGEPVWCKWLLPEDRAIEQGKWFIVISGDKAGLEIKRPAEYGCHFCKIDDYGKTWLAYRRPPEGEEET